MKKITQMAFIALLILPLLLVSSSANPSKIEKSVMGSGGDVSARSGEAIISYTLGQTAIEYLPFGGAAGGDQGGIYEGFWTPDIERILSTEEDVVYTGRSLSNFPNPLTDFTTIKYELENTSEVSIRIYDINGVLVKTLATTTQFAGVQNIEWNATDEFGTPVASGSYLYELSVNPLSGGRSYSLRNVMVVSK